jgi:uncharacterized protein YjdB
MKKSIKNALLIILIALSVCPWDNYGIASAKANDAQIPIAYAIKNKTVEPANIALSKTKLSIGIGESATLEATISPSNATD